MRVPRAVACALLLRSSPPSLIKPRQFFIEICDGLGRQRELDACVVIAGEMIAEEVNALGGP